MQISLEGGQHSTFLVTGGAGFIGSHLVRALIEQGHQVRILDDFSTGKRSNVPSGVEVIHGDVAEYAVVSDAISGAAACFHLAAIASVARSTTDWAATSRINLGGTVNVLDTARTASRGSPIPVVFASSAAVYGNAADCQLCETQEALPLSAYGADKRACELHGFVAARLHDVPCIGLRFFNVYGPRQDPSSPYSGVISRFAEAISQRSSIQIHGDGDQVRDFVFVEDVVDALLKAMQNAQRLRWAVFNVCTGYATSIRKLAELMHAGAGQDLRASFLPARQGDIRISLGDPSKASSLLGWQAKTPLELGLRATLAWQAKCLQH